MYVLKRTNKPGYVSKPGHRSSYCTNLIYARKYPDRETAIADSCVENEVPIDLDQLLAQYHY